jgi:hypothetical protein
VIIDGAWGRSEGKDLYNMAHVLEDIEGSGWQPNGPMNVQPAHPDRNLDA